MRILERSDSAEVPGSTLEDRFFAVVALLACLALVALAATVGSMLGLIATPFLVPMILYFLLTALSRTPRISRKVRRTFVGFLVVVAFVSLVEAGARRLLAS
jgi:hypothetical protein